MAWTCDQCTFLHLEQSQFNFLICSVCESPRDMLTKADEKIPKSFIKNKTEEEDKAVGGLTRKNEEESDQREQYLELHGPFQSSDILKSSLFDIHSKVPVILRNLGGSWKCCAKWKSNSYLAQACEEGKNDYQIRSFLSEAGKFHLDGTNNPATILTCSMAQETSVRQFLGEGKEKKVGKLEVGTAEQEAKKDEESEEWNSMYALDEAFNKSHPLSADVPRFPFPLESIKDGAGSDGGIGVYKQTKKKQNKKKKFTSGAEGEILFTSKSFVNRQLFLSKGRTETQIHRDVNDNVYVVVSGCREWMLIAPTEENSCCLLNHTPNLNDIEHRDYAISSLYQPKYDSFTSIHDVNSVSGDASGGFFEIGHFKQWTLNSPASSSPPGSPSHEAKVNKEANLSAKAAAVPSVKGNNSVITPSSLVVHRVVLRAGDGLFVPAGWWHLVVAQPPYSTAVNWYFSPFHIPSKSISSNDRSEKKSRSINDKETTDVSHSLSTKRSEKASSSQVSNPWTSSKPLLSTLTQSEGKQLVSSGGGGSGGKPQRQENAKTSTLIPSTKEQHGGIGSVSIVLGGDFLEAKDMFLVHQCNCNTVGAKGIAKSIFSKWPKANIYKKRSAGKGKGKGKGYSYSYSTPATIDVARINPHQAVIGLFSQRFPGLPKKGPPGGDDTKACRLQWFCDCLEQFAKEIPQLARDLNQNKSNGNDFFNRGASSSSSSNKPNSSEKVGGDIEEITVAMPFLIGCGLAGGDWNDYYDAIQQWAVRYGVSVKLYDRDRQSV